MAPGGWFGTRKKKKGKGKGREAGTVPVGAGPPAGAAARPANSNSSNFPQVPGGAGAGAGAGATGVAGAAGMGAFTARDFLPQADSSSESELASPARPLPPETGSLGSPRSDSGRLSFSLSARGRATRGSRTQRFGGGLAPPPGAGERPHPPPGAPSPAPTPQPSDSAGQEAQGFGESAFQCAMPPPPHEPAVVTRETGGHTSPRARDPPSPTGEPWWSQPGAGQQAQWQPGAGSSSLAARWGLIGGGERDGCSKEGSPVGGEGGGYAPPKPARARLEVVHAFAADGDPELLSLTEGQSDLEVLSDEEDGHEPASPGGWVMAHSSRTGQSGLVPASYVRVIEAPAADAPLSPPSLTGQSPRPAVSASPRSAEGGPFSPQSLTSEVGDAAHPPGSKVVVDHDFQADGDPELLTVRQGAVVTVEQDFGDGWLLAVANAGGEERSGLLPASYVRAFNLNGGASAADTGDKGRVARTPSGRGRSPPPPSSSAAAGVGLVARCEESSFFEMRSGRVLRRGREGKVFLGYDNAPGSPDDSAEQVSLRLSSLEGCEMVMPRKGTLAEAGDPGADETVFEGAVVLSPRGGPLEVLRYYNWATNGAPTVQARLLSRARGAATLLLLQYVTHPRLPEGSVVATDVEFVVMYAAAEGPGDGAVELEKAAPHARWDPLRGAVSWTFPQLEARACGTLRAVLRGDLHPGSLRARVALRRAGRPVVALHAGGEAAAGALAPLAPSFLSRESLLVLP